MNTMARLIEPDTLIAEIAELYPETVNMLVYDYGFHCVGCFASQFESLEEGAAVHGIYEKDFEELLEKVNQVAGKESDG